MRAGFALEQGQPVTHCPTARYASRGLPIEVRNLLFENLSFSIVEIALGRSPAPANACIWNAT
jgi:hypothetical protein